MFERFTRPARELVERAQAIASESRASQVRPEHLFAALLWDDDSLAVRLLVDQGGTSERLHAELDKRRARYVDGLDDEDAAALASIGIDLEEVVRRLDDDDLATPGREALPARAVLPPLEEGARAGAARGDLAAGTTTSGPSTSCSGSCARATSSSATPWSRPVSTRRRSGRPSPRRYAERASSAPCVTKSISSSTRPSRVGSRSWKPRTPPRMCFHARAMSAWSRCGQPKLWQTPFFHSMLRGICGHAFLPRRSGFTAAQMSMNGCPTISTCCPHRRLPHRLGDPALLGAGHQVVDEHADPPARPRSEVAQLLTQVVHAVEVLHDHALDAQVVAPDLLDELGVVPALDEDPAGPRDAGLDALHGDRPGRRTRRRDRALAGRGDEDDGATLEQEPGAEREGTALAAPVLQRERAEVALDLDDLAAPVGADLFDDEPEIGVDLDGAALLRRTPVAGEHVGAVTVMGEGRHPPTLGRRPVGSGEPRPEADSPMQTDPHTELQRVRMHGTTRNWHLRSGSSRYIVNISRQCR